MSPLCCTTARSMWFRCSETRSSCVAEVSEEVARRKCSSRPANPGTCLSELDQHPWGDPGVSLVWDPKGRGRGRPNNSWLVRRARAQSQDRWSLAQRRRRLLLSRDASPRSGIRAIFFVLCSQLSILSHRLGGSFPWNASTESLSRAQSMPWRLNTSASFAPAASSSRVVVSASTFDSAVENASSAAACGMTTTPSASPKM
jgi:hypothetical protein